MSQRGSPSSLQRGFSAPSLQDNDLTAAWPAVHPTLRLCWAQAWLKLNRADATADGNDLDEVAAALTDDAPDHHLWRPYFRVRLRGLHGVADFHPTTWGIGSTPACSR